MPTTYPSMNEASERDPYNNNSYGTLVDSGYKRVTLPMLDVDDFNNRIIRAYEDGYRGNDLPADLPLARSLIPAGTAALRDFSYIAPEIPEYIPENCTGCMDCVTQCPDTAILGKVIGETEFEKLVATHRPKRSGRRSEHSGARPASITTGLQEERARVVCLAIIIDPSKCKGCAECVTVCDDNALKMIPKTEEEMTSVRKSHRFFKQVGPSDERYINDNLLIDMMLKEQTHIYVGGAGSCAGCGEGTALRMLCSATGVKHGDDWGIVAATGCNTVYTSTYPYNPYLVPWTTRSSRTPPPRRWVFAPAGTRWVGDTSRSGASAATGPCSTSASSRLSRMFASGMNIKVFVLDTQVYSNTGGQASTASYTGQNTKMSVHGKTDGRQAGAAEGDRPDCDDASADVRRPDDLRPHQPFLRCVLEAIEFDGPALISCYTTCQPEHGVADNMATDQARLAVDTRAFPLIIYDPRKGDTIRERMSLQGNPAINDDWWTNPKTGDQVDFIDFARSEGRFVKHFDKDGNPSETLLRAKQDRLENWHILQELAGVRGVQTGGKGPGEEARGSSRQGQRREWFQRPRPEERRTSPSAVASSTRTAAAGRAA